jgi:hypothetical protein
VLLDDPLFWVYGFVTGRNIDDIVAWLEDPDGNRIYGDRIRQPLALYDWGFFFNGLSPLVSYKLTVQVTRTDCAMAEDVWHLLYMAQPAAVTVTISYPPNSPPSISGRYVETGGWVSDKHAGMKAVLIRSGVTIGTGTTIPQPPGSYLDWKFYFQGVPPSTAPNDTHLVVTATPAVGAAGSDDRWLNIT